MGQSNYDQGPLRIIIKFRMQMNQISKNDP